MFNWVLPDWLNYADGECLAALGHMCESEMVYIQAGLNSFISSQNSFYGILEFDI